MLHKIFIQLYDYLAKAVPEAEFASLVPPLSDLVHSYHLEPEVSEFGFCWVAMTFCCWFLLGGHVVAGALNLTGGVCQPAWGQLLAVFRGAFQPRPQEGSK